MGGHFVEVEAEFRQSVVRGGDAPLGCLAAVARDVRKAYFQIISLFQCRNLRFGFWRRRDAAAASLECLERHPDDMGIFGRKLVHHIFGLVAFQLSVGEQFALEVVGLQLIAPAAKGTSGHLLAKQLRPKGTHTANVSHRVGVPPLGEHRHRHHQTNVRAQALWFAHTVYHLAQYVAVGQLVGRACTIKHGIVAFELCNLCAVNALELITHHGARIVNGGTVDEQRGLFL